ncbi:VIT family protein [bacterium]|nr:VIT family protein [bacterium]
MVSPAVTRFYTGLHANATSARLNWLRASVLGANDGIVSIAALVVGVAGATVSASTILVTGIAGLLAGALSMAVGEYVSVSSQRDTEEALLEKEKYELDAFPQAELEELAHMYEQKGVSKETALEVAKELTAHDAFAAHVEAELHIDPNDLTNPWHAAFASAASFTAGALIPLIAVVLSPENVRVFLTFIATALALVVTGFLSARMSDSNALKVITRVVLGGVFAMAVTFGIGMLFGVSGI